LGFRLSVKREPGASVGDPFRQTTELAADLIREFKAPAGVKVMVLLEADDLCHPGVQACRDQGFLFASTLKRTRRRFQPGWKLKAGCSGKPLFRRRHTAPLMLEKLHEPGRYRYADAGWRPVSTLGVLPVVFSRPGAARQILGLGTEAPAWSAAGRLRVDHRRWEMEPWLKDVKPLLGLGQYQKRSSWAAVTPLHLVGFAAALLTPLRLERHGAQGQRRDDKAADLLTAAAQDQLRGLIWNDMVASLKEECHETSVLAELERLRVA
jgi:hypothetical protein